MKAWEELSVREQLICTHSDAFKDAYGFRPRRDWNGSTDEEISKAIEECGAEIRRLQELEEQAEREAIARFEKLLSGYMAHGAKDRKTALRWVYGLVFDKGDSDIDFDHLCYAYSLPYNYLDGDKNAE